MSKTTTIEITRTQAQELDAVSNGSYKDKLQVLIDNYEQADFSEADVEQIARDVVNDMVRLEALE